MPVMGRVRAVPFGRLVISRRFVSHSKGAVLGAGSGGDKEQNPSAGKCEANQGKTPGIRPGERKG